MKSTRYYNYTAKNYTLYQHDINVQNPELAAEMTNTIIEKSEKEKTAKPCKPLYKSIPFTST